jgi:hypothetical protein
MLAGCEDMFSVADDEAAAGGEAAKAPAKASVGAPMKAPAKAPAKAAKESRAGDIVTVVRGYKTCLGECQEGDGKSETDLETCRLTCEQLASTESLPTATKKVVDATLPMIKKALVSCADECRSDKKLSVDDRETCKLNCSASVTALVNTLVYAETGEPAERGALGCDEACGARKELCEQGCSKDKAIRATDRETCKLLCGANVRFCAETCNQKAK